MTHLYLPGVWIEPCCCVVSGKRVLLLTSVPYMSRPTWIRGDGIIRGFYHYDEHLVEDTACISLSVQVSCMAMRLVRPISSPTVSVESSTA